TLSPLTSVTVAGSCGVGEVGVAAGVPSVGWAATGAAKAASVVAAMARSARRSPTAARSRITKGSLPERRVEFGGCAGTVWRTAPARLLGGDYITLESAKEP